MHVIQSAAIHNSKLPSPQGKPQCERRGRFRINGPIPATVSGFDSTRAPFAIEVSLDDLSSGGLRVRLGRPVSTFTELSFVIRFPLAPGASETGIRFAAKGIVRRVESCIDGSFGLGVEFTHYRQIWR